MATPTLTRNGWPLIHDTRTTGPLPRLRKWNLPGTDRYFVVRDGAVGFLLVHAALVFHRKVERLDLRSDVWDEWGYAPRNVREGDVPSEHHAGAAIDVNATRHPMGVPVSQTFTAKQLRTIRFRLRVYRGCVEWGGFWSRPDGMHYQAARGLKACERVARLLCRFPYGREILKANPGARAVIFS